MKENIRIVKGIEINSKPFTCKDVCLKKDGKHAKGHNEYNSFEDCEGGAKTEESKDQKEEKTKDENKNDEEEKESTKKEEKDKKKKAARRRRMRRDRF